MNTLHRNNDAAQPAYKNLAFIGCGNMGQALIKGLLASGWPREQIVGADPDAAHRDVLETQLGCRTFTDNGTACRGADVLILAVKPQHLQQVLHPPGALVAQTDRPLILSLVAGTTLTALSRALGNRQAIVRAMPNTPALLGKGASGLLANPSTTPEQKQLAECVLGAVGITVWCTTDAEIDAVTAVSGCGPAYFFLVMEAMEQAAMAMSLPQEKAKALIFATAEGAALLARDADTSLAELRRQVTSPGGSTEQAVKVLLEGQFHALFARAMGAAEQRAAAMARASESSTPDTP